MENEDTIECSTHGTSEATFICTHLFDRTTNEWYSAPSNEENLWPDAWCEECHKAYTQEGEWNEISEAKAGGNFVRLICVSCYENRRHECKCHLI